MKLSLLTEAGGVANLDKRDACFAAVAVASYRGRWLLGLSKSRDDRFFKWCMPGGGIEKGETPEAAAVRECREETNAHCKATGKAFFLDDKPGVAFVPCVITRKPNLVSKADEFVCLALLKPQEFHKLDLYDNVRDLVRRVRR